MSGFEVAGLVLGVFPLVLTGVEAGRSSLKWLLDKWTRASDVYHREGLIPAMLLTLLPDAAAMMRRMETILSGSEADMFEFRQSVGSTMNMVAVAGAIVAQVAITGLSLTGMDQAHWTAVAFLVASLIFGALSVYVCFVVQQEINGLLGSAGLATWLSRPPPSTQTQSQDTSQLEDGAASLPPGLEASALSAIILATPSGLLGLSLNAFVFGIGVYFGCVYTDGLVPNLGKRGSLGILIFYLVAATTGTFLYTFPRILKATEKSGATSFRRTRGGLLMLRHPLMLRHRLRNSHQRASSVSN